MFTLVSQPWNRPVPAILQSHNLTGKPSHQSSPAPCIGSGSREFKTQPWLLFPGWSESLVKAQDALRKGGPSDSSLLFPAREPIPKVLNFGFHITSRHPTTSVSTGRSWDQHAALRVFHSHNDHKLTSYFLFLSLSFICHTWIYNIGNLTSFKFLWDDKC